MLLGNAPQVRWIGYAKIVELSMCECECVPALLYCWIVAERASGVTLHQDVCEAAPANEQE